MKDFEAETQILTQEILFHERPPEVGIPCDCHPSQSRTTYCEDCNFCEPSCSECFIKNHKANPFHWAHFWDGDNEHGRRVDISLLRNKFYPIPLGHRGSRCPMRILEAQASNEPDWHAGVKFTVITQNGIHGTMLEFCSCNGGPTRVEQLMRAKLFPASVKQPLMAFTFSMLKAFRSFSFRTKCSAHDYVGSLQRLTDNSRPWSLSVSLCLPDLTSA